MTVLTEIQPHFDKLISRGGSMGMHAKLVCVVMRNYMRANEHKMSREESIGMCREYYKLAQDEELSRAPRPEDFVEPCTDSTLDVKQIMKETRHGKEK